MPQAPIVDSGAPEGRRPGLLDLLISVSLAAAILSEIFGSDMPGTRWLLVLCALTQGAALAWRRQFPRTVAIVEVVANVLPTFFGTPSDESTTFGLIGIVVGMYALGRYAFDDPEQRPRTVAAFCAALGFAFASTIYQSGIRGGDFVFISIFAIAPFAFGRAISTSQKGRRDAELKTAELAVVSEQLRDQAVQDERERIARELHDVIAHSVSLMGLQAGAARMVLTPGNEEAARSLRSVEETGRDTLNELRRMLGVMRSSADGEDLAPQPGLGSLPAVVARHRESGAAVELILGGGLDGLSPGVDLAAFRIVQEALTNSMRHAPDSPVAIEVGSNGGAIELKVVSSAVDATDEDSPGGGHGIVGMHQRAALYGGSVSAGLVEGEGFVVQASLPADYLIVAEPVVQQ
jgi:signal transduction histidine kinase